MATALALFALPLPAAAFGISVSGFATIGYAVSDRPYDYQRFIDDHGTLRRDSVAGLQVDAEATSELGATVQVKAAPDTSNDKRYEASVSWAFVSWRPTNDWLFRAGKQRIPFYLYSETYDVGVTYDFARLPIEMYSLAPSNDFTGLSFSRNWRAGEGEFTLDGYAGKSKNDFRIWSRDGLSGVLDQGATFVSLDFRGGGLVLSYRTEDHVFRIGVHRARIEESSGAPFPTSVSLEPVAPGVGYYTLSGEVNHLTNTTVATGVQLGLPHDLQLTGEWAWSRVPRSDLAPKGSRGYLALTKHLGRWSPYVSGAYLRSPGTSRELYAQVNDHRVPDALPGAALIDASQRVVADNFSVYDQVSVAIGASYAFSPKAKLKAELLHTRVRDVSKLVDEPEGGDVRHQGINVFSLSFSAVF